MTESSNDRRIGDTRNNAPYLGEARDKCPEHLFGFLPHCIEVGLHTVLLVSTGEVRGEPRTELFPGLNQLVV